MRRLRLEQPAKLWQARSQAAQERLLRAPCWQGAASLALYMPAKGETGTDLLLRSALADGRRVFYPRVIKGGDGRMEFVEVRGLGDFAPGAFGIMEPGPSLCGVPEGAFSPDLVVVPGLAFDRRGRRLGFGGGYYDRFFAQSSRLTLAGFCFSFQLCREVPADPWDVTMDAVCTDEELVLP
jgi:5-formyltetrahydrofolate cyclo-ligase